MAFFLVSKGYADFVILTGRKKVVEKNFQLDDIFEGNGKLYNVLNTFQCQPSYADIHPVYKKKEG